MMRDAYSAKELAGALKKSIQCIHQRADKESWPHRPRAGRGGGKEFLATGLPQDVRAALAIQEAQLSAPALPGAVIPDWSNGKGLARFRLVQEWRALRARNGQTAAQATSVFLLAYNAGQLLPGAFAQLGRISAPTLYRWDKQLRDAGEDYTALADRRGGWAQGQAKGPDLGPETERIVLQFWLQPNRPSMARAHDTLERILGRDGLAAPSYATVRRFLTRFDESHHDLVVLRREGEKALKDKVGPYITRDSNLLAVGDVLFCDGHRLNFDAINPYTGKPGRMALICWQDWRSRLPIGWEILPDESTVAISSALRMAIMTLGKMPKVVYIDNGRSFRAKYFTEDADLGEFAGLYARLGIAAQFSKPYEARTKVIERFFGTFNEQAARYLDSYRGRDIKDKPAHLHRNEKFHQKRHNGYVPTIQEVADCFAGFVNWHGRRPHRGLRNECPLDVFTAGRGPGLTREEQAILDRDFQFRQEVFPKRCRFTLANTGIQYESDALYGLNRAVTAKYTWSDLSVVDLYMDGKPLGEARPVQALNPLAKHFGDHLDLLQVGEANRRMTALKRSTMRAAAELGEDNPGLEALPFLPKPEPVALTVIPKRSKRVEPELSAADRERLEARARALAVEVGNAPAYQVPAFGFHTPLERYEFLFQTSVVKGIALHPEDAAFMASYEASDEYREATGARFAQLRSVYQKNKETRA